VTSDLKKCAACRSSAASAHRVLKDLATGSSATSDETVAIDTGGGLPRRGSSGGGYQRIGEMIRITARVIDVNTRRGRQDR